LTVDERLFADFELRAEKDRERLLDGKVDSVRVPGVSPDRLHEGGFVLGPNLVAAVAAESLASEHVAANTWCLRLEAR
jgi:hypothetical protein